MHSRFISTSPPGLTSAFPFPWPHTRLLRTLPHYLLTFPFLFSKLISNQRLLPALSAADFKILSPKEHQPLPHHSLPPHSSSPAFPTLGIEIKTKRCIWHPKTLPQQLQTPIIPCKKALTHNYTSWGTSLAMSPFRRWREIKRDIFYETVTELSFPTPIYDCKQAQAGEGPIYYHNYF